MDSINLKNLRTNYLGKMAFYYNEIDSTQKEIWRRVKENTIKNGTVIISNIQTDGIGTHGRIWYTERNNIAFSFVIFPNCNISKLNKLTREIAEIIVNIFEEKYKIKLHIKSPNDLIIKGKKVGGILTETKLQGNIVKTLVIGIGINTNQNEVQEELTNIATSIKSEFEIEIDNESFISDFLNRFEKKFEK